MFTSDKNKFIRRYNGPVDISKLNIKLLDDRGNLLNLNGSDWSLSMISTTYKNKLNPNHIVISIITTRKFCKSTRKLCMKS